MTTELGNLVAVTERVQGDSLTVAAAAGATTIYVDDAADFLTEGPGSLLVNGQIIAYTTVDDATGAITLSTGLDAAAEEDDRVDLYDTRAGDVARDYRGRVVVEGDDFNGEAITATIRQAVVPFIVDIDIQDPGIPVEIVWEDDEAIITDIVGRQEKSGVQFWDKDTFTVTTAGDQTFTLTHEPIDGSLHMIWNGLDQPRSESSVSSKSVTVPDPDGLIEAGDVIDFKYAYRSGVRKSLYVPLGALWRIKYPLANDPATYAATGFDDSTWQEAPSAFGWGGYADPSTSNPQVATVVSGNMELWQRLDVVTSGGDLLFATEGADTWSEVYLDGEFKFRIEYGTETFPTTRTVPCPAGKHTIAVYAWDNASIGGYSGFSIQEQL